MCRWKMYPQNPKKTINRQLEKTNPFYESFKHFNEILNNDDIAYKEKCVIISDLWQQISLKHQNHKLHDIVDLMEWGKHHTLDIIFDGKWNRLKDVHEKNLLSQLTNCEKTLGKVHENFVTHIQGLIKAINRPWESETLRMILQNSSKAFLTDDDIALFANESGYSTTMRVKKLVDAQCEDFAINLCSSYMKCLKLFEEGKVSLTVTEDQKKYAFDMYIMLLYRAKRIGSVRDLFMPLNDVEGRELVGRFATKNIENCKVWRHSNKVTFFAALVFLHRLTKLEKSEDQNNAVQILKAWFSVVESEEDVNECIVSLKRLLLSQECTPYFIYTVIDCCKYIKNSLASLLKHLKVELYIRALTKDINHLEMQRSLKDERSIKDASKSVSDGLLKLAVEMANHIVVARECALSAFSVDPTQQGFDLIEDMARRCGYTVLDTGQWDCKFHAPSSESDDLAIECQVCKKYMMPITLRAFNTNTSLSEALTAKNAGLPQDLCDDLVIVLCSPRYQLLSWLQEWVDLHRLCIMYLDNPEKTKNYITDLKFVQIDYSLYLNIKKEPVDEVDEYLGYDKVLDDSEPEFYDQIEEMAKKKRGRKKRIKDSSDEDSLPPQPPTINKSDPAVLKSLRSFRKATKRKSDSNVIDSLPKVHATEEDISRSSFMRILQYNSKRVDWNSPMGYSSLPSTSGEHQYMDEALDYRTSFRSPVHWDERPQGSNYAPMEVTEVAPSQVEDFDPFQEIEKLLTDNINTPLFEAGKRNDNIPGVIMEQPYIEEIVSDFFQRQPVDDNAVNGVDRQTEMVPNEVNSERYFKYIERLNDGNSTYQFQHDNDQRTQIMAESKKVLGDVMLQSTVREKGQLASKLVEIVPQSYKKETKVPPKEDVFCEISILQKKQETLHMLQKPLQDDLVQAIINNEATAQEILATEQLKEEQAVSEEVTHKTLPEKKVESPPKVLKSDNSMTVEQKLHEPKPDIREPTNQEKNLFREKSTEGVFVEETTKMTKKIHRDSNENKENSGYIAKRRPTRRHTIPPHPVELLKTPKSRAKQLKRWSTGKLEEKYSETGIDTSQYDLKDITVVLERLKLPDGKMTFVLPDDLEEWGKGGRRKRRSGRNSRSDDKKPLTDKNPRVVRSDDDSNKPNGKMKTRDIDRNINMNPKVILHRLDINHLVAKSVLANVPGMKDMEFIQPEPVANVVQVVQTTGRPTNSSTSTQTSTQVSPHIQRIGQPRIEKPEVSNDNGNSTSTSMGKTTPGNSKPTTTQSSLINILSHPVIRQPSGTNSNRPVINILSNQILRPANSTTTTTTTRPTTSTATRTTTTSTPSQSIQSNNNTTRVSEEAQILNQVATSSRQVAGNGSSIKVAASSESSRIVQFICHSSDGKLIPVSSFTQNCVVKVASSQNASSSSSNSPTFEENFTKVVQSKLKTSESSTNSENSETLPKFQQAFGKSVYQSKGHATNSTNITNNVVNHSEVERPKITVMQKTVVTTTTTTTSVKPIPGGVIYTRQVQSGQTINLIPQTRGQVFRIATSSSDQISVVKDTLIQNKMSALLAAALSKKESDDSEAEKQDESTPTTQPTTRVAIARPGLVQNARIVKPVLQIPGNVIRNAPQTNLSSTTLEQLREFDMVYKQVKERSSTTPASDASSNAESPESQCISVTYLNQGQKINCAPIVVVSSYSAIQPVSSPALNVVSQGNTSPRVTPSPSQTSALPKVTQKTSKGKTVKTTTLQNTSKTSPIPKPQQKPQEDEHTTQRIFDILAEYAEQLRNSPDLNNKPAPRRRSNPPTNPNQNSKRKKSSSSKKPTQSNSSLCAEPDTEDPRTLGSEDSSCGVMQLSVPDDDQPTTLASTSESNDSTSTPRQQLILTDSSNQPRNLIIAESSVGEALKMPNTAVLVPGNYIMPVSMVKGGQQIAVVSGGSKILATVPARSGPNMLLFQSFLNQTRKTSVPTVKYSTIQPISGISSQSLTGVTAQPPVILPPLSHGISAVTLGQPITVKKLDNCGQVNTELLLTISQSRENDSPPEDAPQPDSSTNIVPTNLENVEIEEATTLSDNSSEKSFSNSYQKPLIATPIATPVIAQTATANTTTKEDLPEEEIQPAAQRVMTLNINPIEQKGEPRKNEERVQTVLVTAASSNGPMIAHTRTNFKETRRTVANLTQQNKDDFLRNNEKRHNESKNFQTNNVYSSSHGKIKKAQAVTQRLDRELQQLCLQRKQAALERELRLQKSLSEECEDLGVDEPSTSDLFPEAELLFDSNHSPSFEQSSDITKRIVVQQEGGGKEEAKLTLFNDDDFLFEAGEYQNDERRVRLLTNGQSGASGEGSIIQTCNSMSDVTLNSPTSPFRPMTPPPLHKFVHKYSNRKKSDRPIKQVDNWTGEVSSSEDTTGSSELVKSSSPEICLSKITEEELAEGNFKVVRVAITKRECGDCTADEGGDCSLSGRGARRSVKKLCSCCNGAAQDTRKRPAPTTQHSPIPQKKVFPVKKR